MAWPTTSLMVLDTMKKGSAVSVAELIKETNLRMKQIDSALHHMLRKGMVLHPKWGYWQISSGGISYIEKSRKKLSRRTR